MPTFFKRKNFQRKILKMVCENPKYIYFRKYYPIYKPSEEELKRLNKPKWKYDKGYTQYQIPCGHCLGCRLDHANEWATRLYCEMKTYKEENCCFLTLSYNPQNLPIKNGEMTLVKKDMQLFFKRLRKKYPELKIRYLYCGEYGPKSGRPHYHACVFGYRPKDLIIWKYIKGKKGKKIPLYKSHELYHDGNLGIWGKGFVTIEDLNYNTACYTARYVQKKAGLAPKTTNWEWYQDENEKWHKRKIEHQKNKEDEFIEASRRPGLGWLYWQENKKLIKEQNGILVKTGENEVKLKKIPRAFKKWWEEENYEEFHKFRYENIKKAKSNMEKLIEQIKADNLNDDQKLIMLNIQTSERLHKNADLLKRDRAEMQVE